MDVNIEIPPRGEGSVREQLQKLQSYLSRTAQQLQWAFDTLKPPAPAEAAVSLQKTENRAEAAEKTFADLKQLIIKSADIVEACSDQIRKKLEGEYVASSQFGTYREKVSQELTADARGLEQLFTVTEKLESGLQSLSAENTATRAYLRSGCLQEGERPIYGLEVGQRTQVDGREVFRKYARFTADRLSFYDGSDVEVAYISDYKLCITNAQITGTLTLGGRFRLAFDQGLTFQWTGGGA